MNISVSLPIIAYLHSPYQEKFGIPRQPNLVDVYAEIELLAPYNTIQAFEGIEQFSHLWLMWHFHDNKQLAKNSSAFRPQIRPPRLGGNEKIGVFASRSMYRPSPIGLSVVRFLGIEQRQNGLFLQVSGADLLNGTPILDIKPYLHYADAIADAQSGYAHHQPQLKRVFWTENAEQHKQSLLQQQKIILRHLNELEQILALDPRPAYQHDPNRVYAMKFANVDVKFKIDEDVSILALEMVESSSF